MTEEASTVSLKRNVNIESAIDKSSFQIPVFVAISAEGGEAQVIKTFATAREVFDHVFSILLDRLLQRRAVEAVASLVPQPGEVTASRDTEYVLLVRGKAIFWFNGAAAKRAAARRLLLEHARELAEAENAPFYVLNSRTKKVRAALFVASVGIAILGGLFLMPLFVNWTREMTRRQTQSNHYPVQSDDRKSDRQTSVTASDVSSKFAGADRFVASATVQAASRVDPRSSGPDPTQKEPQYRTALAKYEERMASFVRTWPDRFQDGLVFTYSFFNEETTALNALVAPTVIASTSHAPTVAENHARVSKPGASEQIAGPDKSKK
jgi:hypothetical protein